MRTKLKPEDTIMFDESVRLGRAMEGVVKGGDQPVEVDWALRVVILSLKSGKTAVVPFENVRFMHTTPPDGSPRARA